MSKIIYWLFSKTQLGKLIDGNKRLIGFSIWLLAYLIEGLAEAGQYFPDTPVLLTVKDQLVSLSAAYAELLKNLGISVMAVGVASDAAWQKHNPAGDDAREV